MKIISKEKKKTQPITLRIDLNTIERVDKEAKKAGVSRQWLIWKILEQVLDDPKFVLRADRG